MAIAEIVDLPLGARSPSERLVGPADPVQQFLDLEKKKARALGQARRFEIEQYQLLNEHRGNPGVLDAVKAWWKERPEDISEAQAPVTIESFLKRADADVKPSHSVAHVSLADRSNWSPKLRALIDRLFPEETREERIRLARETPPVVLGEGLSMEEIRYYAEDVNLEYDV